MTGRLAVVKVGGSLLDWPGLPGRLAGYLESRKGDRLVLVVGGGRAADWVRDLDRLHALGPERSHALALRSLDFTAALLAAMVPGLEVVDRLDGLGACWASGRVPVLPPRRFLDEDDARSAEPLPHSWDVTSDSIAARLAVRLGAGELVLLKSAPPPPAAGRAEAARLGLVDPAFPAAARPIPGVFYFHWREPGADGVDLV